jgi:hypothetical protein
VAAWWRAERPTAAWLRRQGGDFSAIVKFLYDSEARQRRFAPVVFPAFGLAALLISLMFFSGINNYIFASSTFSWGMNVSFLSEVVAVSSAFGLWRYSAVQLKRAVLAGVTIFVLNGVSGVALASILLAHNVKENDAIHWWVIFLLAPCTLLGMAIFDRAFRSLLGWILIIALLVIPLRIAALLKINSVITDQTQTFLFIIGFLLWFAGIGYQMRLGSGRISERQGRRRKIAPMALAVFVVAAYWVNAFWIAGWLYIIYGDTLPPWSWLVEVGAVSEVMALTAAFGLWRFADLGVRRSVVAGVVIFILEYASAAALIGSLLSLHVPLLEAEHWWGATLFAPCILFPLAVFVSPFRRASVWLTCLALFAGPYALLVWLNDSALLPIPAMLLTLLILLIASVWFASIGYQLQRGSPLGPSRATAGPPWGALGVSNPIMEETSPKFVAD